MNVSEQHHFLANYFPATEVLERCITSRSLPEREYRPAKMSTSPSSNSKVTTPLSFNTLESKPQRKRSFNMADLLDATKPVQQAIAFPTIEWCRGEESDDEPENDNRESHETAPLGDDDEDADYFPSSFSSSGPGKRSRLGYSGLTRSKSLKTSLCNLGEGSTGELEVRSWSHFLTDEDEILSFSIGTSNSASKYKRQNSCGRSGCQQMQLNFLLVPLACHVKATTKSSCTLIST
jgi:hypothetical protein